MSKHIKDISEITYSVEILEKRPPRFIMIFLSALILMLVITFIWLISSEVEISVDGVAIVESQNPTLEIMASVSGEVENSYIKDGKHVNKGDTLLEIKPSEEELLELEKIKNDLTKLEKEKKDLDILYESIDSKDLFNRFNELSIANQTLLNKYKNDLALLEKGYVKQLETSSIENQSLLYNIESQLLEIDQQLINLTDDNDKLNTEKENSVNKTEINNQIENNEISINSLVTKKKKLEILLEQYKNNEDNSEKLAKSTHEEEVLYLKNSYKEKILSSILETKNLIEEYQNNLEQIKIKINNYTIKAPVDGLIQVDEEIKSHQIIQEGSAILSLIQDGKINNSNVIVYIDNQNIRSIDLTNDVFLKFPSNSIKETEKIEGNLEYISNEPIYDENKQVTMYYARIEIESESKLPNGLQGEAIFVTDRVKAWRYLLSKVHLID